VILRHFAGSDSAIYARPRKRVLILRFGGPLLFAVKNATPGLEVFLAFKCGFGDNCQVSNCIFTLLFAIQESINKGM
jgi:hypothetical protein